MSQTTGRPCPTCGTQVPGGQRICSNCGTDLSRVEAASQYGGPQQQNLSQGQQVSPNTQSPYGQQQQPQFQYQPQYQLPQQSPQPRRGISGWLVLLLIIMALLIGGSGWIDLLCSSLPTRPGTYTGYCHGTESDKHGTDTGQCHRY